MRDFVSNAINNSKFWFFVIAFYLMTIMATYLAFDSYLRNVGIELVTSWVKTEEVNLQQGNILSAISKNQRMIFSSSFVQGVSLIEKKNANKAYKILASFGKTFPVSFYLIKNKDTIDVYDKGFFHKVFVCKLSEIDSLYVMFDIAPTSVRYIYVLISIFLFVILFVFTFTINKMKAKEAAQRLELIKVALANFVLGNGPDEFLKKNVPSLVHMWNEMTEKLKEYKEQEKIFAVEKRFVEAVTIVVHDIRTPLAELNVMLMQEEFKVIPDPIVNAIRRQMARIQDIAGDLLVRNKLNKEDNLNKVTSKLMMTTIEEIVIEKRAFFRSQGIKILLIGDTYDPSCYGLFANINLNELRRVLSSLITNAIEAVSDHIGQIIIKLRANENNEVCIEVDDNGHGISEENISRVCEKGFSYGKENKQNSGSGIGLYYSKETVEKWGGMLLVSSILGVGTKIIIKFPKIESPKWFAKEINLNRGQTVVVLNDEVDAYQIWSNIFTKIGVSDFKIDVLYFFTTTEFRNWYKNNTNMQRVLFLCDYKITGCEESGLDLIKEINHLGWDSILVTGHFENEEIISTVSELNIKLIPKLLSGLVPINIEGQHLDLGASNRLSIKKSSYLIVLITKKIDSQDLVESILKEIARNPVINSTFMSLDSYKEMLANTVLKQYSRIVCIVDLGVFFLEKDLFKSNARVKNVVLLESNDSISDINENDINIVYCRNRDLNTYLYKQIFEFFYS